MPVEVIIGICVLLCLFGCLIYYIHRAEEFIDDFAHGSLKNQKALRQRCERIEDRIKKLENESSSKEKKMTKAERSAIEDLLRALISKENALDFCISTVEKCEINDSELADRADLIKYLQDMKTGVQEYIRELTDRVIGQCYFKIIPEWDKMPFKGIGKVVGKYIADASILVVEKKKILSAVESVKDELFEEQK